MAHMGYTFTGFVPERMARAIGRELRVSPKMSSELCRKLKGMPLEKAKDFLKGVAKGVSAVPVKRYNYQVVHQKGGVGPGRFPKKAAQEFLKLIEGAENNAEYAGMDTDELRIRHIAAYRGRVFEGNRPRAHGRASPHNRLTSNVELVVEVPGGGED